MATQNAVLPVGAFSITTSDSVTQRACGIYVGTGGDVAVMPADQEGKTSPAAVTFKNVPAGTVLPIQVVKVMSTNTTASDMVGLR